MDIKKIFDLFRKKKEQTFPRYEGSAHQKLYEEIAKEMNDDPQNVYEIAHGKIVYSYDDRAIREQLKQRFPKFKVEK